jgi:hypothetical protein
MSNLVAAFNTAAAELDTARKALGELPTDQREAAREAMLPLIGRWESAARVLIADASPRHPLMEERSSIYLRLGGDGRWQIDSGTDHGVAREGQSGARNEACLSEHAADDEIDECRALADALDVMPMPNARQLLAMLLDELI